MYYGLNKVSVDVGWFLAKLNPKTVPNGSGLKDDAEHIYNQPRKPILLPFGEHIGAPVGALMGAELS